MQWKAVGDVAIYSMRMIFAAADLRPHSLDPTQPTIPLGTPRRLGHTKAASQAKAKRTSHVIQTRRRTMACVRYIRVRSSRAELHPLSSLSASHPPNRASRMSSPPPDTPHATSSPILLSQTNSSRRFAQPTGRAHPTLCPRLLAKSRLTGA